MPLGWRIAAAVVLVGGYAVYVWRTLRAAGGSGDDEEMDALFFDPTKQDPPHTLQIAGQLVVSLAAIVAGAELFVRGIESIATSLGISALVLALVLAPLAPLASELPEKANSVLWIATARTSSRPATSPGRWRSRRRFRSRWA